MLTLTTRDIWPNPERKLQLRCGWPVRIYTVDHCGSHGFNVVAAYSNPSNGIWTTTHWTITGRYCNEQSDSHLDIIEAKPAMVRWFVDCEEGKTPIVFVPTGEKRKPGPGDTFLNEGGVCHSYMTHLCREYSILTPVTPTCQ